MTVTLNELLSDVGAGLKNVTQAAEATPPAEGTQADPPAAPVQKSAEEQLAELQAKERARQQDELAKSLAADAVAAFHRSQEEEAQRVALIAQAEIAKQLGEGGASLGPALEAVLKGARGGSKFVAQGTDPGNGMQVAEPTSLAVGEHKGAKEIREGKNLAHFLSIIARVKSGGEFMLNEGEKAFLRESQAKAMAEMTNSAGGFLVHPEWMPDILGLLRAQAVVRRAQPRLVPFAKEMNQTSISSGATAYYRTENSNITPSELVVADAPLLTPKNLTGLVPVSNWLLTDAPEADSMVRTDIAEVIGLREDLAFLQGTGTGGEPLGMKNMVGRTVNPITVPTDGFYMSLPQFRAFKNVTRLFNSQNPRWVLFINPAILNHWEGLTDADGRFLADSNILRINEDQRSGTMDGVPFFATTQIPINITTGSSADTTYFILVDANELIIGDKGEMEFAVSTEASYTPDGGTTWISAFQATQTLFRASIRHDIAHRRPNHIIVQGGVRV
jgi:HK97 family phage major capsid protein